jgi:quercetin dioxygenase-like cupin family protein
MGSQLLAPKSHIRQHVHQNADEILVVHQGQGIGILGDSRGRLQPGSVMFVPAGVWHGVENSEQQMELLWYVSPPGLDAFFRDLDKATDSGNRQLTPDQLQQIAKRHGDTYKAP